MEKLAVQNVTCQVPTIFFMTQTSYFMTKPCGNGRFLAVLQSFSFLW